MKIEITILGLLMQGNLYGYEIKKKIVERLKDYVDIKFGSIYYAIKKAVDKEWVKRVGTEKDGGNPERYIYEIMPLGRKYFRKMMKQYFDHSFIHFNIDIVLMFYNFLTQDQKDQFIEDRLETIKEKQTAVRDKLTESSGLPEDTSQIHLYSYIESHLKAEIAWLKSLKRGGGIVGVDD